MKKRFSPRTGGIVAGAFAGFLALALPLTAHDFWLVPDAFRIAAGESLQVRGQTSDAFPSSEIAVGQDRIASARLVGADGETTIDEFEVAGTSLILRHRPARAGQQIVAVTLEPRSTRVSAEEFRRYLELEGVPELLARLEREGRLSADSITRRWTKYAKTLVEVGEGGSRVAARAVGHPLELVPLRDPAQLTAGDTLAVRLVFRGQPLTQAKIHAGVVEVPPGADLDELAGQERHVELWTDAEGRVRVPLHTTGLWNVRTLQVVPSEPDSGADWDSHWATLVFEIADPAGVRRADADSAAVAATVDRFHAALAAGDSAAVADLLAPDVVILENGVQETRDEYLGGHLHGDIAFARAVPRERGSIRVTVERDVAWATSRSVARGEFQGRQINSAGVELMVLRRTSEGWRIAAIHWSSRTLRS